MLVSLIINLVYSFQEAVRFLHVGSLSKLIKQALKDPDFMLNTMTNPKQYFFK